MVSLWLVRGDKGLTAHRCSLFCLSPPNALFFVMTIPLSYGWRTCLRPNNGELYLHVFLGWSGGIDCGSSGARGCCRASVWTGPWSSPCGWPVPSTGGSCARCALWVCARACRLLWPAAILYTRPLPWPRSDSPDMTECSPLFGAAPLLKRTNQINHAILSGLRFLFIS